MMEDCKLQLNLEDKPGALSKVLDIIARHKGNLFSVSHLREGMKAGKVPVVIRLQASAEDFTKICDDLVSEKIEIIEKLIGGVEAVRVTKEFLLIGHVIDTDIRDTIYSICDKDVMIRSLDISLKSLSEPSSAFVEIAAKGQKPMERAMKRLEELSKKKNLLLITGIE